MDKEPLFYKNETFLLEEEKQVLETNFLDSKLSSPLILGSGTLIERFENIQPFIDSGVGAIVPRTTRLIKTREKHPSPHLYQDGKEGNQIMINCEWTGPDINYWKPYLEHLSKTGKMIMSVSGRDIDSCFEVCETLDNYKFPLIEINIGCPHSNNTYGWINRSSKHISELLTRIKNSSIKTKVGIKLSHSDSIIELSRVAKDYGADCIIAINSFGPVLDFDISNGSPESIVGIKGALGGLSGSHLFNIALTDVAMISKEVKIPVIACGGVSNSDQVLKMMMAGADAVEVYTASHVLGKNAPKIFSEINQDLFEYLRKFGFKSINEVKNLAHPLLEQETNLKEKIPFIDKDLCILCGRCVNICLQNALSYSVDKSDYTQKNVTLNIDKCNGCGHCKSVCPVNGISIL